MDNEDKKKDLEKEIRSLVRSSFDLGGIDFLSRIEGLVAREAAGIRKEKGGRPPGKTLSPEKVHRERFPEIIGNSQAMLEVFSLMNKVAPTSVPVLIQGESGTGKELVARSLHQCSARRDKEYVAENCAAIPETLLESELFGYKKGAFTGAQQNKQGLFVVADGGTLFLDEIGDMSPNMQRKLLRVLQDGEIRPVGGNEVIHVDVRILSASNKDLKKMVDEGLFRKDLFFRLNTITLSLPSLRERAEDIPDLAKFFIRKIAAEMGIDPVPVSDEAMKALTRYRWPGNIRELENELRRCLALKGKGEEIGLDALSGDVKNC